MKIILHNGTSVATLDMLWRTVDEMLPLEHRRKIAAAIAIRAVEIQPNLSREFIDRATMALHAIGRGESWPRVRTILDDMRRAGLDPMVQETVYIATLKEPRIFGIVLAAGAVIPENDEIHVVIE